VSSPFVITADMRRVANITLMKDKRPPALLPPGLVPFLVPAGRPCLLLALALAAWRGGTPTGRPSLALHMVTFEALLDPLPEFSRRELKK
jgi:hypothetical protein